MSPDVGAVSTCPWQTLAAAAAALLLLLLLQCAESEKTSAGGVLLANDSGDRPNFGTVVAVGEGKKDEEGKTVAPNVAVGATVMYSKYSGTEFEVSQWLDVWCCRTQGVAVQLA
jgi:co-chaperonin GroES (HSP10)